MTEWHVAALGAAIGYIIALLLNINKSLHSAKKANYASYFYVDLILADDQLLASAKSKRAIRLPFPPYPGLSVATHIELGSETVEFTTGVIKRVTWNAESECFDCQIEDRELNSKQHCDDIIASDQNKAWDWWRHRA